MNKKSNEFELDKSSLELFLADQALKYKKIAYFSNVDYDFDDIKKRIFKINPDLNVVEFPCFDCFFFSNLSPTNKNKSDRISCLHNLVFSELPNKIIISSLEAIVTNTINFETLKKFQLVISNKCSISYDKILNFLVEGGYERVDFVHNKGEFAIRGEIMDIFSPIHQYPLRILFDFEKIEKLSLFSTENQLSIRNIKNYYLSLSSEFQFNSENIESFRSSFRQLKVKDKDDYYKSLSQRIVLPGSEQFFPILNSKFDSFLEKVGAQNNAFTSSDITNYYITVPSNNLELGLWLESERMLHPVINQIGVDTQNEVVKEEKRLRVDNSPYGRFLENVKKNLLKFPLLLDLHFIKIINAGKFQKRNWQLKLISQKSNVYLRQKIDTKDILLHVIRVN